MRLPDWLGFRGKTLWDWLQLLIVPAILIAVTFAWSATQTRSDNKREDRRIAADRAAAEKARQDATLQAYLDEMSGLMLKEKLRTSKDIGVRDVARTITLTTLRRLDGERKAEIVQFLFEASLLNDYPVVNLEGADLEHANLQSATLTFGGGFGPVVGANLTGADFTDANLAGAYLDFADLTRANLKRADLVGAHLAEANLTGANLEDAELSNANLEDANLEDAKNLDLDQFIADLPPKRQKAFLHAQKAFLDALSREELAKFNLTPEKLAKFRREAFGS
jgi:hypothetical protein